MTKKVYVVTVSRSAYVVAESKEDAADYADQIDENEDPDTTCVEATENVLGWFHSSEVYHADSTTTKITAKEVFGL